MVLQQQNHSSCPRTTDVRVDIIAAAGIALRFGRHSGVRGFTIIELLAVLVIMGIAIAVVVPSFNRSPATELEAAARSLAAGLRWTRSHAVTGNEIAELAIDLKKRQFLLPDDGRVRALPTNARLTLYTARSQVESEIRGSIRFFPDGSSSGGRITVANERLAYIVDVDWFTGKVRLLETDPDAAGEVQ